MTVLLFVSHHVSHTSTRFSSYKGNHIIDNRSGMSDDKKTITDVHIRQWYCKEEMPVFWAGMIIIQKCDCSNLL